MVLRNPSIRNVISARSSQCMRPTGHRTVVKDVYLLWFWFHIVPACLLHLQTAHVPPVGAACICSRCTDDDSTKNCSLWVHVILSHRKRAE